LLVARTGFVGTSSNAAIAHTVERRPRTVVAKILPLHPAIS
jgi:hypothetical protein